MLETEPLAKGLRVVTRPLRRAPWHPIPMALIKPSGFDRDTRPCTLPFIYTSLA